MCRIGFVWRRESWKIPNYLNLHVLIINVIFKRNLWVKQRSSVCFVFSLQPVVSVVSALTGVFPTHRCNNVLYIRGVEEEEEDGEMREWCWWRGPVLLICLSVTVPRSWVDVCLCFHHVKQMNAWGFFFGYFSSFFFFYCIRPFLCCNIVIQTQ